MHSSNQVLLLPMAAVFFFVGSVFLQATAAGNLNTRPVIGILTQPAEPEMLPYGDAYIAASYVRWMESAGAMVVPIPHTADKATLLALFKSINGLIFPGGGSDISSDTALYQSAAYLFELVLQENARGGVFPLHGTCMGFELLNCIVNGGDDSVLTPCDAENLTLPLNFTSAAASSLLFGHAPGPVLNALATEPITMNNHGWCVSETTFNSTPSLEAFWTVLSTNEDRARQVAFVSTLENSKYHVTATQWHPEKNQFEWNPGEVIQHTVDAVLSMQYVANTLVGLARMNNHSFPTSEDLWDSVIYNFPVAYTFSVEPAFVECYFFHL